MKLFLLAFALAACNASELQVSTVEGELEGRWVENHAGKRIARAFLGVPFATPPIGELRFKKPEPAQAWKGVLKVVNLPKKCHQSDDGFEFGQSKVEESEDCLYLNVFAPLTKPSTPIPVMVFIHGGGFNYGSTSEYGVEGGCEMLVQKGVVLVVIQYRLGAYGFLSSGDERLRGNFGMWDQVEALRWVQRNIGAFGGDRGKVTIFGESAGAMSVSMLNYAPLAQDLYHQAICMSGTTWTQVYTGKLGKPAKDSFELFAKTTGCAEGDMEHQMGCLRKLSPKKIRDVLDLLKHGDKDKDIKPDPIMWMPTEDGELMQGPVDTLSANLRPKPTIYGSTNLEMAMLSNMNEVFKGKLCKSLQTKIDRNQNLADY